MIYFALFIWLLGWSFSVGFFPQATAESNSGYVVGVILLLFVWPLILGAELREFAEIGMTQRARIIERLGNYKRPIIGNREGERECHAE